MATEHPQIGQAHGVRLHQGPVRQAAGTEVSGAAFAHPGSVSHISAQAFEPGLLMYTGATVTALEMTHKNHQTFVLWEHGEGPFG